MVRGIEVFRDYFHDFRDQYVLIGGSACDLLFTEAGVDFRATRDLDLVLIVEALTPEFGRRFWEFIQDGGYRNRNRSSGTPQYYRFDKPQNKEFPSMIELFSRTEALRDIPESGVIPVHIDDGLSSLSAILLDEDYYQILMNGKDVVLDIVVLKPEFLIVFKAKAFLDIKARREDEGLEINDEAKKHMKDVIRLTTMLSGSEAPELSDVIKADMLEFIDYYEQNAFDPQRLDLPTTAAELIDVLRKVF